jgi:hypothetical protein
VFTARELARQESREMESERKASHIDGLLFRYYTCSACGQADIFVDLHPLAGESAEVFHQRRTEMEATIKQLHGDGVEIVIVERP